MQIKPFRIEEYYARHEFSTQYMLSSSDAESRSIGELLSLEEDALERFLAHRCGYTEYPGAPWLRADLANIYNAITPDDVLVLSSAEEGIFVFYHAILKPGDHIIVETPCYESAVEVARSTGAQVSEWRRRHENGWAHDVDALARLIQPNTRVIYINTPHNPTGITMPRNIFERVVDLARERGILLFCDEVYRELEHNPAGRLPAACDIYEHAISMGSVSKTYGLPGLRLGWLATRDASIVQRCLDFKNYTTICNSAPSEFLTALAMRHRAKLADRNLGIIRGNLPLLEAFFHERQDMFEWVRPNASTIGFALFKRDVDSMAFCQEAIARAGVLLLPGAVYDEPRHIRFGFGRTNMPEALERLRAHLGGAAVR